jgi:hypothetical protein
MATWAPISNTVPQYSKNAGGAAASDYYIKFYADGTTTPINMATDATGGTTLAKCQINSLGYPINGSSDIFIPHIDQDYKLALYENETDADNNTLASAVWVVDELTQPDNGLRNELIAANGTALITHTDSGTDYNLESYLQDRHVINIEDFTGVDMTAKFNAAIAYANANGGNDAGQVVGFTFKIPSGTHTIGALDTITVSGVFFEGVSAGETTLVLTNGLDAFTVGNGTDIVVGFGISKVKFEYTTITGASTVIKLSYAFRMFIHDILLVKVGTLISAGTASTAAAGGIFLSDISGSVANIGVPLFDLRWGAGLSLVNVGAFVSGVGAPTHNSSTPGVDSEWPSSILPESGRSVFRCEDGAWDTCQVTNCIFERFDTGLSLSPAKSEVYQAFFFNNVIMDYFKRYCVYALAQSDSTISTIRTDKNCWFVSWNTDALYFDGGGFNDNHDIEGNIVIAGVRGLYYNVKSTVTRGETQAGSDASGSVFTLNDIRYTPGTSNLTVIKDSSGTLTTLTSGVDYTETSSSQVTVTVAPLAGDSYEFYTPEPTAANKFQNLRVTGANRLGTASGAFEFTNNSKGFQVLNCSGNNDSGGAGITWRAPYGLQIGTDAENYQVTGCKFEGLTDGYNIQMPTAKSPYPRRVFNNDNANYAGYSALTLPASTVNHENWGPFTYEIYLYGGTVTGYDKNGQTLGTNDQYLRIQPLDTFNSTYSVAPTLKRFIEP